MLSHDWPTGIHRYGDTEQLLRVKPFLREDVIIFLFVFSSLLFLIVIFFPSILFLYFAFLLFFTKGVCNKQLHLLFILFLRFSPISWVAHHVKTFSIYFSHLTGSLPIYTANSLLYIIMKGLMMSQNFLLLISHFRGEGFYRFWIFQHRPISHLLYNMTQNGWVWLN